MNLKHQFLNDEIMMLRHQMNQLGNQKEKLTDPDLVTISQLLDHKLNQYYWLSKQTIYDDTEISIESSPISVFMMTIITLPYLWFLPHHVWLFSLFFHEKQMTVDGGPSNPPRL
ncbi:Spo0E family sporulation regulatory protein-aspartic acid phosphatase [Robertmurraya sp.]|uniref:Spo0E family sporulation regulatory protein-aspartic acid phosphatase n=1 Tax=Robertmurraya sp. TaxID=2837525 RepID=UPI0037038E53